MVKKPKIRGGEEIGDLNPGVLQLVQTDEPSVKCTKLPEFIRAKKHLGAPFCVYVAQGFVPEATRVVVEAGNFKNPCAELKNNVSRVFNGVARFDDLRFLGKSGRGTRFNVFLRFECEPRFKHAVYSNAIKVTVDGPRPPRHNNNKQKSHRMHHANLSVNLNLTFKHNNNSDQNMMKPIKKRYREFLTDIIPTVNHHHQSTPFIEKPSSSSKAQVTPHMSYQHHRTPSFSSSCSSSCYSSSDEHHQLDIMTETATTSSSLYSSCSNISSFMTTPASAPSTPELVMTCNERATESWSFDRQSILHYLEIYMDLYKIRTCRSFSNYLVDLVLSCLQMRTKTTSCFSSERNFFINYNLFYQNLINSHFLNPNPNYPKNI